MPEGRGLRKSTDWLQAKTDSGKRCSRRSGRVLSSQVLEWRKKLLVGCWKGTQLWGQEVKLGSGASCAAAKRRVVSLVVGFEGLNPDWLPTSMHSFLLLESLERW